MADRKFEKKVARRMVALALEPYLQSQGKFARLYKKATMQTIESAYAESAMSVLRIRHEMRAIQDAQDDLIKELSHDDQ